MFSEVPIPPRRKIDKSGSRIDVILYQPGVRLITIEYKTTSSPYYKNNKDYIKQVNKGTKQLMAFAKRTHLIPQSYIRSPLKQIDFIQLLTIRKYGDKKKTDDTIQVGDILCLPDLKYCRLFNCEIQKYKKRKK